MRTYLAHADFFTKPPPSFVRPLSIYHERKALLLVVAKGRDEAAANRRLHLDWVDGGDLLEESAHR